MPTSQAIIDGLAQPDANNRNPFPSMALSTPFFCFKHRMSSNTPQLVFPSIIFSLQPPTLLILLITSRPQSYTTFLLCLLSQVHRVFSQILDPHFTSTYTQSTLLNLHSIPQLLIYQKCSAIKLATGPELDSIEAYVHDNRLRVPHFFPLCIPSLLPDRLQPQSVDIKAAFVTGDFTQIERLCLKLPHHVTGCGTNAPLDSGQSTMFQRSP